MGILGPKDIYEYKCEKCGATKTIRISGAGRKLYQAREESMCDEFGCFGAALLQSVTKGD